MGGTKHKNPWHWKPLPNFMISPLKILGPSEAPCCTSTGTQYQLAKPTIADPSNQKQNTREGIVFPDAVQLR